MLTVFFSIDEPPVFVICLYRPLALSDMKCIFWKTWNINLKKIVVPAELQDDWGVRCMGCAHDVAMRCEVLLVYVYTVFHTLRRSNLQARRIVPSYVNTHFHSRK